MKRFDTSACAVSAFRRGGCYGRCRLSALLVGVATALCAGGCLVVGAVPSTVEVVVRRPDTNQPIQNALIEAKTSAARGAWGVAFGPPEYMYAYSDEQGRAKVQINTGPAGATFMYSTINISAPGFGHVWFDAQDDDRSEGPYLSNGTLTVDLKPDKWKWHRDGEPWDHSTFVVERLPPKVKSGP